MSKPTPISDSVTASLVELQAASQALARARTNEEGILTHLQEQVRQLLPPSRIHVLLFLRGQTKLFAWNREGEAFPTSYFETPAAQGILGWLRETKESLLVRDFERDWDTLPAKPTYENPHPPRSAIFVPLVVADEALGALSAQSNDADVYTPDHVWQLKILANQAAAAFRAGHLLRTERLRANQLETLAEVSRSVVSILDLDELLTHVVDVIEQAFGYYHVQVFVTEEGQSRATFRASSGATTHELWRKLGKYAYVGEGIIGWVLEHGEALVAPDVSIDPKYIPDDPRLLPDTRSEIAVPLRLDDEVLGVLDVQSDQLNAFDREDLFVLDALADTVALAVDNARLYTRVQQDAWVTVVLLEVAEATSRLTNLDEVVDTVVRITPMLTGVTACAIWLTEANQAQLTPKGQFGIHEEMVRLFYKQSLLVEENPALDIVQRSQQPLVLRPPELDELLAPIVAQTLLEDAIVLLPLFAKGDLMGVMAVSVEESDGPLSETRTPLLKGIADQAASAIESAQLIIAQQEEAWVSTALLQVAQAMGQEQDLAETLRIVARLTAVLSGLDRCTLLLRRSSESDFEVGFSYALARDIPPIESGTLLQADAIPLLDKIITTEEPVIVFDAKKDDLIPYEMARSLKIGAAIGLPLIANGQVVGAMIADAVKSERVNNPRLLDILMGIANQAAVAIERARLQADELARRAVATELAVARNIQRGFLPEKLPDIEGYEIAAMWVPAREIGGDFYDFIPLEDDNLCIVVADVADKGIPAALYMALSRTTMRLVSTRDPSPANALQLVNTAILDTTYSDLFVTIYYAVLDSATHQVRYASGGHGLALQGTEQDVIFLRGRGTALGIVPTIVVEEHITKLGPGDYFLIYTDGVTDAINKTLEAFSEARLAGLVEQHRGCTADQMLGFIHTAVKAWEEGTAAFDDFTLVVIRRAPE